jgi:hypothetical protein
MTHITIERAKLEQVLKALKSTSGLPHWPAIFATIADFEQALAAPLQPGRNHYEDGDVFERIAAMKKPAAQPAPESGSWYAAKEIDEMVRDLDAAMNGDCAAPQAKLCDLMPQLIERLTQPAPVQEPVAVVTGYHGGNCVVAPTNPERLFNSGTAFYTTPPAQQKPWVDLTDEEIMAAPENLIACIAYVRNKLKEKNT